jgi:hypothetical protein
LLCRLFEINIKNGEVSRSFKAIKGENFNFDQPFGVTYSSQSFGLRIIGYKRINIFIQKSVLIGGLIR